MGKKQTCPAIKLKAKKAKILAANLHCNIPKARPRKHTGIFDHHGDELDFTLDALKSYRELKAARKEELKKFSDSPARRTRSKTPWYMLSKAKYHYETHKESWGDNTQWFKVESESTRLHNKTIKKKFTHEQLIVGMVQNKVKDWEKTNPEPLKEINGTKNAFYDTEHREWMNERCKIWNKSLFSIKNRPEKLMTKYLQQTNPELMAAA